uniref:Paxillin n=1 Tax=Oryzias sinensis TaxID=183150 RepID=A0A8C7WWP0_9TELE
MDDLDALLADLESTTSHISKRPVFLPDETPYSIPIGGQSSQDVSTPPPLPPPPSAEALNGTLTDRPNSHISCQLSLGSAQKSSWSRDSSSSPLSHAEEDHVYSFPNKHKTSDSSSAAMTSGLGSNLSELDRLLLELNAVQKSSPSFPTTEEAAPPLPSCSIIHFENGGTPEILLSPPSQEKSIRNGAKLEESRPTVKSLLDELEGPVPSPSPPACHSDLDTPSQQQTRISASCATRELDELMASLSDFKPNSWGALQDPGKAPSSFPSFSSAVTLVPFSSLSLSHPPASTLLSLSAGVDKDESSGGRLVPRPGQRPAHSPASSLSAARDIDLDSEMEGSATMLASQTKTLLVLSQSAPSNSSLLSNGSSLSNIANLFAFPVETVLDQKASKSYSLSGERISPSVAVGKVSCAAELLSKEYACCFDNNLNFYNSLPSKRLTPPDLLPHPVAVSQPSAYSLSKISSPSPVSSVLVPSPPKFTSTSRQLSSVAQCDTPLTVQQPPIVEPSLDEALDKLLEISFSPNHTGQEAHLSIDACHLHREAQEELILPMDRSSVQPNTFTAATNTLTDYSQDGGTEGNGDLDWADEELSMSLRDGLDGTMTPYTERLYTDGSMTPLTEASWMDESMTPSSCPGSPDVALDLPLLQTPTIDSYRVSASGHIKSVIRRTKETANFHPMYRDGQIRRKMGPIIVNKNSSQDRLIEELQGKLGIARSERRRKQSDDWLTEGVVVSSKPQRFSLEGVSTDVDKIVIPSKSPLPARRVLPPLFPPTPVVEESKLQVPVPHSPVPIPPPPPPPACTPPQTTPVQQLVLAAPPQIKTTPPPQAPIKDRQSPKPQPLPVLNTPARPRAVKPVQPAAHKVLVSVGCQTEYDPIFPLMQIMAQGKGGASGGPPTQVNKLDNMLGSLQSDLHKLGVQTVAKGVCGACCKPIVGQVVTAMGRTWHPEHFVCTHCQEEIGSRNFFEREGQPYCEKDYHNLFSPRCYYCNGPILDKVVTALDRTWHPEHFFCAQCGTFFGPEGFHEKDGKAYCRKDYFDMFAPKCGGCARAILENYISALNCLWHPECFVCRECFIPFVNGSFFEHDGQPYCEVHYHERRGSLCSGCQKPITGRCITAMSKKFHPEHFVCAFCLKQLNKGTFKEQNDKPYCHGCFVKLFS